MTDATKVTLTARTSAITITALSSNFTTTSNGTYVDVTGLTQSVPDKYFVSARYDSQKSTAGSGSVRLVHGAGPTVDQTGGLVQLTRLSKWFQIFQNVSGSAVTYKCQARSTGDTNTFTVFQSGATVPGVTGSADTIQVNGPYAILNPIVANQFTIWIKTNITTFNFICLGAVSVSMMGATDPTFNNALTSVILNNNVDGIYYFPTATTAYAEGGTSASTGGILLFYDWSGDNVLLA